jgi:hypothetical protein
MRARISICSAREDHARCFFSRRNSLDPREDLLAMAGLTPEDAEAAMELLEHEQADQAVRDRFFQIPLDALQASTRFGRGAP